MARLSLSRIACLVLVLLVTASPTLLAAGLRHGHQQATKPAASGFFSQAWAGLFSLFAKNGSEMDPNGAPTQNGSTMDPDGKPQPPASPTSDLGSIMDPDGGK
jgi:hypothetical protein